MTARVTDSEFLCNDTRNLDDIVLKENGKTSGRRNAKKRETDGEKGEEGRRNSEQRETKSR